MASCTSAIQSHLRKCRAPGRNYEFVIIYNYNQDSEHFIFKMRRNKQFGSSYGELGNRKIMDQFARELIILKMRRNTTVI